MTRTIAALLCLLMTVFAGAAHGQGAPPHLAMTLVAETPRPRAGSEVTLALGTRPQPGWHGYWGENTGDAGFPPKATWTLPAGATAGAWQWPVPSRLLISGLMNYVYERPYAPLVTLRVPAGLAAGTVLPVRLKLDYLVCTTTICVPEAQELATTLMVGDGGGVDARFDGWRRALPRPLGSRATWQADGGAVRIAVPWPRDAAIADAYFYPKTAGTIDYAAPQTVVRDGDRLVLETKGKGAAGAFAGVLSVGEGRAFAVEASPGTVAVTQGWLTAALLAFGGAVLGGLILNIMPCVFPILSLKALSLAKSGAGEARREAVGYTAGVVAVCVGLGAAILLLRAGGSAVGWAFQLQDPRMIALLLALSVAIAANVSGLWEVPGLSFERVGGPQSNGWAGAFATGALAAFVATPCTGPFMAAALGAALVLPWGAALAVFGGLGLGLALPFLLVGFVPALRRRLPKPGAWMERARRVLAVPMWLTAVALVWLLWRTADRGLVHAMLFAVGLAAILVALGRGQRQQASGRKVFAALAIGWIVLGVALTKPRPASARAGVDMPFSEVRLAQLRAAGKPVFAYFTADWCLTCKVNERVAIDPSREALRKKGVAVLVGDWTDGDPALGRFIQAHERAGVPLYLYYAPGQEARVLPQVLTPGMLAGL